MNFTSFTNDIKKGKIGELIFQEDFLEHLNINYRDVTGCQSFQVIDTDYLASIGGKIEVKTNYKDDKQIIIEDYTHIDLENHEVCYGWIFESKANLFAFVSKNTRTIVFLPNTDQFKSHYIKVVRKKTDLIMNRPTVKGNNVWRSAFRKVPFDYLRGFISVYKKI